MNLSYGKDDEAFRDEVKDFLARELTAEMKAATERRTSGDPDRDTSLAWLRALNRQGWAAPRWPVEYGGTGWTTTQTYIFERESALAGAPLLSPFGIRMCGPAIMKFGTPAQKDFYLPRILDGTDWWCQGYSEPNSGSDLASLQMRAKSENDRYILNGSKVWTTHAQYADRMFCLVRTAQSQKPQTGITFLLVDMRQKGVQVEPIIKLSGEHILNAVIFDDVTVPKTDRLGSENEGWTVAKYLLEFERGGSARAPALRYALDKLRRFATDARDADGASLFQDRIFRQRFNALEAELDAVEMTEFRIMAMVGRGEGIGPRASLMKTTSTELTQRISELAIEAAAFCITAAGEYKDGSVAVTNGRRFMATYLNERAASIYGGTNEIQRNIMAKMILGLS
ncbi:MAG: acyl-CoA dehydrogenase family protein [Parvibaculum sp.]|uniref:acyl-CoA dehydrogenase family protein n=1 Tax=Parvibaculum sp. TaxID=2024848 RepID=UPI003C747126